MTEEEQKKNLFKELKLLHINQWKTAEGNSQSIRIFSNNFQYLVCRKNNPKHWKNSENCRLFWNW